MESATVSVSYSHHGDTFPNTRRWLDIRAQRVAVSTIAYIGTFWHTNKTGVEEPTDPFVREVACTLGLYDKQTT